MATDDTLTWTSTCGRPDLARQPALAGADEGEQHLDLAVVAQLGPEPLHGLLERQLAPEEDAVGLLHPGDLLLAEPVPGQADAAAPPPLGPVPRRGAERRELPPRRSAAVLHRAGGPGRAGGNQQ